MSVTWIRGDKRVFYIYGDGTLGNGEKTVNNLYNSDPSRVSDGVTLYPADCDSRNNLLCKSVLGWDEILPNTISAIKFLLENYTFDFLIRTNQSTYWNLKNLVLQLKLLPSKGCYAGPVVKNSSETYVTGDSIFLSRDVAKTLVANSHRMESRLIDDLAIGKLLAKLQIKTILIERPIIFCQPKLLQFTIIANSKKLRKKGFSLGNEIHSASSVRCKDNHHRFLGKQIRLDTLIIVTIHLNLLFRQISKRYSQSKL